MKRRRRATDLQHAFNVINCLPSVSVKGLCVQAVLWKRASQEHFDVFARYERVPLVPSTAHADVQDLERSEVTLLCLAAMRLIGSCEDNLRGTFEATVMTQGLHLCE
eukprot:152829-Amphidinium_carterae.1